MTELHLVKNTAPIDDISLRLNVTIRRNQLLEAACRYILEGRDGHLQDRVRTASDLSGVPRNLLLVEVDRRRK